MDTPSIIAKPSNGSELEEEKVTILMCVFNSSEFIRPAIESVLLQTYKNFELIIVDDCSTDNSWQIACSYAEVDPRIKTSRTPYNQGASAALNQGLKIAIGDYITRLDSDDIMFPNRLAEQIYYIKKFSEAGAVGTNARYIDTAGNPIGISSYPLTNEAIQEMLPDYMCFCGPSVLVSRDAFVKAGFYFVEEYSSAEDYDLCLRLSEVTQMGNLEPPLYGYRQHQSSVSAAKRHLQLYYKARSLEAATYRRYNRNPPRHFIDYLARDYLRAAVLGWLSKDIASSEECLELALSYNPELLRSDALKPSLGEVIMTYLPKDSLEMSIAHVESMFQDLFPNEKHLARLKSRLIGDIYIREAFARAKKSPINTFEPKLVWKGVQHDPRWLANRGVVSTLFKQYLPRFKTHA